VLTIFGGTAQPINDGRAVFDSFSSIPGEWSVFVDPSAIGIKGGDSYQWSVELRNSSDQVLASNRGCFNT
ncbi:MAG: hypothetical protein AAGD96_10560, partial [Chloroflexota bacterium]